MNNTAPQKISTSCGAQVSARGLPEGPRRGLQRSRNAIPFDLERDIDHVTHALKFLKSDGYLTAIMSAGTEFRETKKAIALRALVKAKNGRWTDLPPCSFSSVGTNVNTIVLRLWNNGRGAH